MSTQEVWKTFEPENYYRTFLDNGRRPDGRSLKDFREVTVKAGTVGTADGSSTVRLGHTTVICGVKAELATPTLEHPDQGFVVPNVELHPCSSPNFSSGPPGVLAIDASQFISKVLTSADVLDLTDLCIVPNKYAWCLHCDMVCINYDGNMHDAALLAVITALQNVSLPVLTYDEEEDKASVARESTLPLAVKNRPVSSTFTLYSHSIQLSDPSEEDETNGSGAVTCVAREDRSLCYLHKPGGCALPPITLDSLIALAGSRVGPINQIVEQALDEAK